jgi:hypothetical protein
VISARAFVDLGARASRTLIAGESRSGFSSVEFSVSVNPPVPERKVADVIRN